MATYNCRYCGYKTKKDSKPDKCNYCSRKDAMVEEESVDDLLDEA